MSTYTDAWKLLDNLTNEEQDIVSDAFSKYCHDKTEPDYDGLGNDMMRKVLRMLITGVEEEWKKYDELDDAIQAEHTYGFFIGYKEIATELPDEDLGAVIKAVFYSPERAEFKNPLAMEFYQKLCDRLWE